MQEMKGFPTEQEIKKRLKSEVFKKTLTKICEKFKLKIINNVVLDMVEKAVDEALTRYNPYDVVLAYRYSQSFCEKCGECCRKSDPIAVNVQDLTNLAFYLGVTLDAVIMNYTKTLKDGRFSLKAKPCPFLDANNECSIYPVRPNVCRFFPLQGSSEPHKIKLTLKSFDYCAFCKNLFANKAYMFILLELLKKEKPELYKKIKQNAKKLQGQVPDDWIGQIKYIDKLMAPQKKKTH